MVVGYQHFWKCPPPEILGVLGGSLQGGWEPPTEAIGKGNVLLRRNRHREVKSVCQAATQGIRGGRSCGMGVTGRQGNISRNYNMR